VWFTQWQVCLIIHTTDMRLCELDAHLDHKVEFGFGILGVLRDKTYLSIAREEVLNGQWTTTKIRVHLDGSILLLKRISRMWTLRVTASS